MGRRRREALIAVGAVVVWLSIVGTIAWPWIDVWINGPDARPTPMSPTYQAGPTPAAYPAGAYEPGASTGGQINVRGYYRGGTYVAPHTRSAPGRGR